MATEDDRIDKPNEPFLLNGIMAQNWRRLGLDAPSNRPILPLPATGKLPHKPMMFAEFAQRTEGEGSLTDQQRLILSCTVPLPCIQIDDGVIPKYTAAPTAPRWSPNDPPDNPNYVPDKKTPVSQLKVPGGNLSYETLVRTGTKPFLAEALFEGAKLAFGDPSNENTRYVVVAQGGCRECGTKHAYGVGEAIDYQIWDRQTGKLVGGTDDIMKNAFNNPSTFRMFEAVMQGAYKYMLTKYGEEYAKNLTSGLYFHAIQGGFDNMHISWQEGGKDNTGQSINRYGSVPSGLNNGQGEYIKGLIRQAGALESRPMNDPRNSVNGDLKTWVSEFHPDYKGGPAAIPTIKIQAPAQ